jgi:serine/threonine protein kinase
MSALKKLKTIVVKKQKLSSQFYAKLIETPTITKVMKSKIKAFYNDKANSRDILLKSLDKIYNKKGGTIQDIDGIGEYNSEKELGSGAFATSYQLLSSPDKVIKVFKPQKLDTINTIINNINEFEEYIYNRYEYMKDKTTFIPLDSNIKPNASKFFYLTKYCDGSLLTILQKSNSEYYDNLENAFNLLKEIYEKRCPFVHEDIKLENILYKEHKVFLHDLDGIFIYDPDTLLHVNREQNPFERQVFTTPFTTDPYILWYRLVLADEIEDMSDLLEKLSENLPFSEGMWNSFLNKLDPLFKIQIRNQVHSLYNMSFKDYIKQSLEKIGNNKDKMKKWIVSNLALCDLYSYFMSILYYLPKYNNPFIRNLKNEIFSFMKSEVEKIFSQLGGKRKNMKGSGNKQTQTKQTQTTISPTLHRDWSIGTQVTNTSKYTMSPMNKIIIEYGREVDNNGKKYKTVKITQGEDVTKYKLIDGKFIDEEGNKIEFDDDGNIVYV